MAAQGGLVVGLRIKVGGSYVLIGAAKTKTIKINNGQLVDVTNADSQGRMRELLLGVGVVSISMTVAGVFKGDSPFTALHDAAFNNTAADMQVFFPGLGNYQGLFQVSDVNLNAPHNEAAEYSCTLESAGVITLTRPGS